ncbi:MAG: PAS domain S-box protein [Mariprofundaceae bacterium]|nr:PAS domain S-box protein [Mariprofundaceae bacterium]
MRFDFREESIGLLAIAFGLFYWPLETLIHVTIFDGGSFVENLLYPSAHEAWMRLLVALSFIAFGVYAHRAIRQQQDLNKLLQQEKTHARSVIESAHDAYVCIDTNSVITDWNPRAEKMFGWPRSDAVGKTLLETIIPERFHEAHRHGMQAYLASGNGPWLYRTVTTSARHRRGSEIHVEMAIIPLSGDGQQEFYAFIREIP